MRLISLFLVLLSLSFLHAEDMDRTFGNKRVQLVGRSGQIRILPANATKGDVFTQLKWAKLEEVNPQNHVVQMVNTFANQDASWSREYQTMVNGINATAVKLTANLNVNTPGPGNSNNGNPVPIAITVFLFDRTVTVDNGNTTVTVDVNSIKFNVEINGWPFLNRSNTLVFGVSLNSGGGRGGPEKDEAREGGGVKTGGNRPGPAHWIQFGPGALVSPKIAQIDSVDTNITITYDGQRNLQWIFPSFTKLVYDPTLGADGTPATGGGNNTGSVIQPTLLVFILTFITLMFRA